MMRLLHFAIFLGAISCIIEFVTKFVKVRSSAQRATTVRSSLLDSDCAVDAKQGYLFTGTGHEDLQDVAVLLRTIKIISAVNCVRQMTVAKC